MSTTVRYEIEVELPMGTPTPSESDALAIVSETTTFAPGSVSVWDGSKDAGPTFLAHDEEEDWSRDHEARDAEVRQGICARYPGAKVTTRWLRCDEIVWDDVFDDDVEADEAEAAS